VLGREDRGESVECPDLPTLALVKCICCEWVGVLLLSASIHPLLFVSAHRLHCQGLQLAADVDLSALAASCFGYSGADLAALVREAAMHALSTAAAALLQPQGEGGRAFSWEGGVPAGGCSALSADSSPMLSVPPALRASVCGRQQHMLCVTVLQVLVSRQQQQWTVLHSRTHSTLAW
jgi:SpoVK/Ycf46/Vps4 family AAA+-type ATPase